MSYATDDMLDDCLEWATIFLVALIIVVATVMLYRIAFAPIPREHECPACHAVYEIEEGKVK